MTLYKLKEVFVSKSKTVYNPDIYLKSELPLSIFDNPNYSNLIDELPDSFSESINTGFIGGDPNLIETQAKLKNTKFNQLHNNKVIDAAYSGEVNIELSKSKKINTVRNTTINLDDEDVYIIPEEDLIINDEYVNRIDEPKIESHSNEQSSINNESIVKTRINNRRKLKKDETR